jgi:prephenate dehydratase
MPKCATQTNQGAKISKDEVTLTVKGQKKAVKVYTITVGNATRYAVQRALAPVDNAKYLPLEKFEAERNTAKPRKAKKAAAAIVELSENAKALVPVIAKLAKGEIKLLAVESLKYKRSNAKLVKAQIKADKLKAKRDALQKQIEVLECTGK